MITDDSFSYLRLKDNLLEMPKQEKERSKTSKKNKMQAQSSKRKQRKNSQNVHFSSNSFRAIWFLNQ